MARQTYYVTREQKHPLYKTRMLQAGPIELDASAARLYCRLGVDLSEEAPKRAAAPAPVSTTTETATAPKRKAAPRKRAAKKAK
jgi:hypothetical protein